MKLPLSGLDGNFKADIQVLSFDFICKRLTINRLVLLQWQMAASQLNLTMLASSVSYTLPLNSAPAAHPFGGHRDLVPRDSLLKF